MSITQQDIDLAKSLDLVELAERYGVELDGAGVEHKGLCPFHHEKSPSFTITETVNRYHCFGCGANGDPIQFIMDLLGIRFLDAVGLLAHGENPTAVRREKSTRVKQEKYKVLTVPDDAPSPRRHKYLSAPKDFEVPANVKSFTADNGKVFVHHQETGRWTYNGTDGAVLGHVVRFNPLWGGKETVPQTWCQTVSTGEAGWAWHGFDEPRPIFGLDLLAAHPSALVVLVEGEKTAIATRKLLADAGVSTDKVVAVTWPGGANGVKKVDWSPLHGRRVAAIPDADQKLYPEIHELAGQVMPFLEQPGTCAMRSIYAAIGSKVEAFKVVAPPDGVPDGWDLADDLPTGFAIKKFLNGAVTAQDLFTGEAPAVADEVEEDTDYTQYAVSGGYTMDSEAPPPEPAPEAEDDDEDEEEVNGYFKVLGYDRGNYYFMQYEKCQIMCMTKGDFTEAGLIELAPLNFWELHYGSAGKIDKKMAMNQLVRLAHKRGMYNPRLIRGRGAWLDDGRHVFHQGQYLLVDGQREEIARAKSRYVYEMKLPLPDVSEKPLTADEGSDLLNICCRFRWSMPASGPLMAGWIALAPVCGALPWRPHVWVSGGAGSGKSQPHTSKVLTPGGWVTMGDISVGDLVTTPGNEFARVIGKFPQGKIPVYKLTFADGRTVRASGDHLWKVRIKKEWRLRTTEQMIEILARDTRSSTSLAVPLVDAIDISRNKKVSLPLHPYVLGALIGDGSFSESGISFSSVDDELIKRIGLLVPNGIEVKQKGVSISYGFSQLSEYGNGMRDLIKDLRLLGKHSGQKFIPSAYLDASIADRFELLKGLMDTDGTICQRGSISYCTISRQLAEDVQTLVRSLGGIASISEKVPTYTYNDEKRTGQIAYIVNIRMPKRDRVFNLQRKLDRASVDYQYEDCLYLNVMSIEPDGEEQCSCIAIDHPDRLYVTDNYVVTHNTTAMKVVHFLLNGIDLFAQGNSTEAGIRQELQNDAIPVLMDEAESNTKRDDSRVQSLISMIRQASSLTDARTYKGSAGGAAQAWFIQSMFCLASIQVNIKNQADIERLTVLSLTNKDKKTAEQNAAEWKELAEDIYRLQSKRDTAQRLVSRSLALLPSTLRNIQVFSEAGALKFGSQRDGDQYGALMAGAWSLISDEVLTVEQALAWMNEYDWSEHRESNTIHEGERAVSALMGALIRYSGTEITVNELVRVACGVAVDGVTLSGASAEAMLQRYGIKTDERAGLLLVSNTNTQLAKLMEGTPFEVDLRGALLRAEGAYRYDRPVKFNGVNSRCVAVPLGDLLSDEVYVGDRVHF